MIEAAPYYNGKDNERERLLLALRAATCYAEAVHYVMFHSHYVPGGMSEEAGAQRKMLMQVTSKLMEQEYEGKMTTLIKAWEEYKASRE